MKMTVTIQIEGAHAWEAEMNGEARAVSLCYNDIANYVMVRGRAAAGGFVPVTLEPFAEKKSSLAQDELMAMGEHASAPHSRFHEIQEAPLSIPTRTLKSPEALEEGRYGE